MNIARSLYRRSLRRFGTIEKCVVLSTDAEIPQRNGVVGLMLLLLCGGTVLASTNITHAEESTKSATDDDADKKNHKVCGQWCANPNHKETQCIMDTTVIPCRGEWCTTTCELWDLFVLGGNDKRRPVSCQQYKNGMAYPRDAVVCDASCLIPEVSPSRYPAPTGLGILCRPNTCSPAATPLENARKGRVLGELQCPCNWFGSECKNDWLPVKAVVKKNLDDKLGALEFVTLILDKDDWKRVIKDYRPGGVVRITHDDEDGIPREFACALAPASLDTPGKLTFLTAPPDTSLHPHVRQVADRIRNLSKSTPINNLFVNPSISGFYNGSYEYLMDYLQSHDNEIRNVIIMSSGAGLGGALSAVDAVLRKNKDSSHPIKIYLYYGLRNVEHLPYRERLEKLAASGDIQLTLVVSNGSSENNNAGGQWKSVSNEIGEALKRGEASRKLKPVDKLKPFLSQLSQPYTQHVVGLDLFAENGSLRKEGACLENTVFVSCGRIELLDDMNVILRAMSGGKDKLVFEHVFTNI